MEIQFKGEPKSSGNDENEYHLEVRIDSLSVSQFEHSQLQIIFIFGDLMRKLRVEDGDTFDGEKQSYTLHSVPARMAEMLHDMSIMLCVVSIADQKPLGEYQLQGEFFPLIVSTFPHSPASVSLDVNDCFANSVNCLDFCSETIKKSVELKDGKKTVGKMALTVSVGKDIGNSNRHRRFYTESTRAKTA